jgi:hypothetical protein
MGASENKYAPNGKLMGTVMLIRWFPMSYTQTTWKVLFAFSMIIRFDCCNLRWQEANHFSCHFSGWQFEGHRCQSSQSSASICRLIILGAKPYKPVSYSGNVSKSAGTCCLPYMPFCASADYPVLCKMVTVYQMCTGSTPFCTVFWSK